MRLHPGGKILTVASAGITMKANMTSPRTSGVGFVKTMVLEMFDWAELDALYVGLSAALVVPKASAEAIPVAAIS